MSGPSPARATLSAFCAILVGIGLARFAYTPLLPALIAAEWFAPSEAAYLGAANLAGYLAGALLGRRISARAPTPVVLRGMMAFATASLFACAVPISFFWFFTWRVASGFAGGVLMVLAAPSVLPRIRASRRGLAGGVIFTAVGLGIAGSGTVVPAVLDRGLTETWCVLGGLAAMLTVVAWGGWPGDAPDPDPGIGGEAGVTAHLRPRLKILYVQYGLNAFGLVPHMVFFVDFVARGLGHGIQAGASYWVLFGVGALLGPVLAGHLADRIGFGHALRLSFLVQACCVGWLAVSDDTLGLILSSLVVGAFVPAISVIALGRTHELLPPDQRSRKAAWSIATVAFAIGQAVASYGFSFLFANGAGYALLFGLSAAALLLAFAIEAVASASTAAATSSTES